MKKIRIKIKKPNLKKIKIPLKIRAAILLILGILVISSLYSATAVTGEKAKTMEQSIPIVTYSHTNSFNYVAHLMNNTVYDFTTITPGQATIFKKITKYLDMSINYKFNCDQATTITGSYTLTAEIQTEDNLWTRTYTITPRTTFNNKTFQLNFQLNTSTYENIVSTINNEIGITATNPTLLIKCKITISTPTPNGNIYDTFTPTITIPLTGNILEINGALTQTKTGELTEKTTINIPAEDISEERNNSILIAGLFFIPIIPVYLFTENDTTKLTQTQKQVKKILKKYGEWIAEVEKPPKTPIGQEKINIRSIEDLIKISEEIGKPVIHHETNDETHTFHVIDENIHYEHILSLNEKTKKTIRCPECKTQIDLDGKPGENIKIECPSCGKKGTIKI